MSGELRAGWLCLALLTAACSVAPGPEHAPAPTGVSPARGWNGAPLAVAIEGTFRPVPVRRLGTGEVELDARFSAWLGETALEDVTLREDGRLAAVVPAGLAPGKHRLRVVGPLGLEGSLEAAFRSSAAPFSLLEAAPEAPLEVVEQQPFTVQLEVANRGDSAAREVRALLEVAEGEASVEQAPAPQELAAGASAVFVWRLAAPAGTLGLRLRAEGTDAESGAPSSSPEAYAQVAVLRPAALAGGAALSSARASLGQTLELRYAVENTGGAPVSGLEPRLEPSGAGAFEILAAPEAPVALAGGARHEFVWSLAARSAGAVELLLSATGTDALAGAAREAPLTTVETAIESPAALTASATAPARVSTGQAFELAVDCGNAGEAAALAVAGTVAGTPVPIELLAVPGPAEVPGAGSRRFAWSLRAASSGLLTLDIGIAGADANSGAPVTAAASAGPLEVQAAPSLGIAISAPAQAPVGGTLSVTALVSNAGEAAALGVRPLLTVSGSAGLAVTEGPTPAAADVAGGQEALFSWTLTAIADGSAQLEVTAQGTDANGAGAVSAGPVASGPVAVLGPAELQTALSVAPTRVNEGQSFALRLTVTNSGGSAASAVTPSAPALSGAGTTQLVSGPTPASAYIAAGASQDFLWELQALGAGPVQLAASASGVDELSGNAVAGPAATADLSVQRAASLSASFDPAPAQVSVGQRFPVRLSIANAGEADARDVLPSSPLPSGTAAALVAAGPTPATALVPGGRTAGFAWELEASAPGELLVTAQASGFDANDGSSLSAAPASTSAILVQLPPALSGLLELPAAVNAGQEFMLTLRVDNSGEAAVANLAPGALSVSGATLDVVSGPDPASAVLPGGAQASFAWRLSAPATGTAQIEAMAGGGDANGAGPVTTGPVSAALRIERPAALEASLTLPAGPAAVGSLFELALEVRNTGDATALAVLPSQPELLSGGASLVTGPAPAQLDLAGGASETFRWQYRVEAAGTIGFSASASGTDANEGRAVFSAAALSGQLVAYEPARLTCALSAPAAVSDDEQFEVALTVENAGGVDALGVVPDLAVSGAGAATLLAGPLPASADAASGSSVVFRWTFTPVAPGPLELSGAAAGSDAVNGAAVACAPTSATVSVLGPAQLAATLEVPPQLGTGQEFDVTLTVTNVGGEQALGVTPSALAIGGTGATTLLSGPEPASAELAGGGSAQFSWRLRAEANGTLELSASAAGTDAHSGAAVASPTASASALITEVAVLAADPFGDGTSFTYLFAHAGKIYVGPNDSGTGAVRFDPDGSNPESVLFAFPKDTTGHISENAAAGAPPFPSIGAPGCAANTLECGPNNEDGRGLFTSGTMGGAEWLVMGGAKSSGGFDHVYLTPEAGTTLAMRYLDLNSILGGNAKGLSSARFFHDRLYLGFPDSGGARPFLLVLITQPAAPGLDAVKGSDVVDLNADKMPALRLGNSAGVIGIDAMGAFADRLYLANNGGLIRSTVAAPRSYKDVATDWQLATPNAAAYTAKTSLASEQYSEIEPAEKAVPAMVEHGGRFYFARNTTAGPQLFVCTPALTSSSADCDPGDWSLVAPNPSGDALLTQFGDPDNTHLTLLAATAGYLYVGFDNATDGVVLYRTAATAPAEASDFSGTLGCSAALGPAGCPGLGGNGLGVGATRIWDSAALEAGGGPRVYLVAGQESNAARVFSVDE